MARTQHGLDQPDGRQQTANAAHQNGGHFEDDGCSSDMAADTSTSIAWLARLWRETSRVLDRYQERVDQGHDLMPALDFARYVLWSGLVPLMKSEGQDGALKIDGSLLEWKAKELQEAVQARFRSERNGKCMLHETQLEALNRKLDLIAGRLAQVTTAGCSPGQRLDAPADSRSRSP